MPQFRCPTIPLSIALSALAAVCAQTETIRLTPGMSPVSVNGIARLNVARDTIPDADVADLGLKLLPETPHHWFASPGEPFCVRVQVEPMGDSEAVLTVWDWYLRPTLVRRWTPPHRETLTLNVEGRGTFLLTLDRQADGKTSSRLVRSFAVCPSNAGKQEAWWGNEQFFLGTCAYPERMHWKNQHGPRFPADMTMDEAREKEAAVTGRLGLQVVRLVADQQSSIDLYMKHGVRPFLKLGQVPVAGKMLLPKYEHVTDARWRYPMPESSCRPHYADVAKRLAKQAVFVEVGNEEDNDDFWRGTTDEFIANATWAAEELKQHAPEVPTCVSGWTFLKPDFTRQFVAAFRDLYPWTSIHAHGDFRRCVEQLDKFESLLRECGADDKPRVQTEMGYCHWRLDMDAVSAAHAFRKIVYHWAKGYKGVITYRLRDQGGPRLAGDTKGMWGMLDHDFCPRFKYGMLAALIDKFAEYRFERAIVAGPDLYAYSFAKGEERLIVVFAPDVSWKPVEMGTLRTTASGAAIIDPMGNESPVEDPRRIKLRSGGLYPVVVRLRDGEPTGV